MYQRFGVNFRFHSYSNHDLQVEQNEKNNILIVDESQTLLSNDFVHYHFESCLETGRGKKLWETQSGSIEFL